MHCFRVEGMGLAGSDRSGDGAGWRVFVSHTSELRDFPPENSYVAAAERAISAAEGRLAEIEAQAEAAQVRVEAAERRASEAEAAVVDREARARGAAAAWLRGQIESVRRETGR